MLAAPPQQLVCEGNLARQVITGNHVRPRRQKRWRQKAVALSLVLLAILLAFGKTFLAVRLVIKGYELEALQQEIDTMQKENERLQLEVARLKAPERVAGVAITRLGMIEPGTEAVYYVPGRVTPGQQVQVATGERGDGEAIIAMPEHRSWLASLAQALQNWLINGIRGPGVGA